jgi:hypothetical protein
LASYISRDEAARLFEGTPSDFFQGDVLESLTLMTPRPGGSLDTIVAHAIVLSHDCEYTKADSRGFDYPIQVAPVRQLSAFRAGGQDGHIRAGRFRQLLYLPAEEPLDDEYAVDLRLAQPLLAQEIVEATHWTTLGPELRLVLQAKVVEYFTYERTLR